VTANFGDFQNEVYAEAVQGVTTRYPFDFASIERKASEALPDWVYRYVSAAAGDGRTQRANIAAYLCEVPQALHVARVTLRGSAGRDSQVAVFDGSILATAAVSAPTVMLKSARTVLAHFDDLGEEERELLF
jgi:hypothetical protein